MAVPTAPLSTTAPYPPWLQAVALCGPSGCGKSTLISLLERFYDPTAGSITLDGVDLRELNVRWLRSRMGLVGQEPVLFMGTVAENISYGKLDGASREEVEEAARAANAHTFITESLQHGYETQARKHARTQFFPRIFSLVFGRQQVLSFLHAGPSVSFSPLSHQPTAAVA